MLRFSFSLSFLISSISWIFFFGCSFSTLLRIFNLSHCSYKLTGHFTKFRNLTCQSFVLRCVWCSSSGIRSWMLHDMANSNFIAVAVAVAVVAVVVVVVVVIVVVMVLLKIKT